MPDNYVDITVRARGDAPLNLDELKAKLNDLGRKVETARVNLAGDKEAQASLTRMDAKPLVLGAFGKGLKIAGHLMSDIQPVAKATGNAIDQLLSRVDAEFQSGTWK